MNVRVTLHGKQGTGKTVLAKALKEALECMGFDVSPCHANDAHNTEHFTIQDPKTRIKALKGQL